jgi:hypothetical protein
MNNAESSCTVALEDLSAQGRILALNGSSLQLPTHRQPQRERESAHGEPNTGHAANSTHHMHDGNRSNNEQPNPRDPRIVPPAAQRCAGSLCSPRTPRFGAPTPIPDAPGSAVPHQRRGPGSDQREAAVLQQPDRSPLQQQASQRSKHARRRRKADEAALSLSVCVDVNARGIHRCTAQHLVGSHGSALGRRQHLCITHRARRGPGNKHGATRSARDEAAEQTGGPRQRHTTRGGRNSDCTSDAHVDTDHDGKERRRTRRTHTNARGKGKQPARAEQRRGIG